MPTKKTTKIQNQKNKSFESKVELPKESKEIDIVKVMEKLGYSMYNDLNGKYFLKNPQLITPPKFRYNEIKKIFNQD